MGISYSDSRVGFLVMASLLFGYALAALNTLEKQVSLLFELCGNNYQFDCPARASKFSFAHNALFIGAAIGSLTCGFVVTYGRRLGLMLTHLTFVVGGLICAFAPNWIAFVVGRALIGLAVGLTTVVVPLYISEMTPANVRGSRGVLHQLSITVGILFGIGAGQLVAVVSPRQSPADILSARDTTTVKVLQAIPAIVGGLALLLAIFVFTDDTPAFHVANDNPGRAARVLQMIYARSDVEMELKEIVTAVEEAKYSKKDSGGGISTLVSTKYLLPVIFGCLLSGGQQLTGVNVFVGSSTRVFTQGGLSDDFGMKASNIMAVVNVLMTFPAVLVDRLGRRTIMATCVTMQTLFQLLYIVCALIPSLASILPYVTVVSVIGYFVFFAIGYGPVLWLYLPEMFPVEIRASACGVASAMNWICCILVVFVGGLFTNNFVLFSIFGTAGTIISVMILLFMRETKGLDYSPYFPAKNLPEEEVRLVATP